MLSEQQRAELRRLRDVALAAEEAMHARDECDEEWKRLSDAAGVAYREAEERTFDALPALLSDLDSLTGEVAALRRALRAACGSHCVESGYERYIAQSAGVSVETLRSWIANAALREPGA